MVSNQTTKQSLIWSYYKELHGDKELIKSKTVLKSEVEEENHGLRGVPAVIDKDLAAQLLAVEMEADVLLILTEVDAVSIRFRQPDEKKLGQVTVDEMERYCQEGHFAAGSMLPKVQAAMEFVRKNPRGKAIITSLTRGLDALEGKCGTTVIGGI